MPGGGWIAALLAAACAPVFVATTDSSAMEDCNTAADRENSEASFLQAPTAIARAARQRKVRVAIFTTPGASSLCCDCPDEDASCCSGRHTGKRTWHVADAAKAGIEEAGGEATIYDISQKGGCPTSQEVQSPDFADAYMLGSAVWYSAPSPDMMAFISYHFTRSFSALACKPGAAFVSGGAFFNGIQSAIDVLHRAMMTAQMIVVGGPHWHLGPGAGAVTGTWPFHGISDGSEGDDRMDEVLSPIFEMDAKALGVRLVNITRHNIEHPPLCGEYPGLEDLHHKKPPPPEVQDGPTDSPEGQ
jgi:multimeric flavodoxin WrbA